MSRALTPILLLLASAASYAAEAPQQNVSVLVPIVGSVTGINNVRWKTDIDLFNDGKSEANVMLSLPTAPEQPFILVAIAPGAGQHFSDIVASTFGMDATLSPLKITTIESARSVRVMASVYGVRDTDATLPEPIAVTNGTMYSPLRSLNGLSFSDTFRTNVGLANLGDSDAWFTLALQRVPGRNVAVTSFKVASNTLVQTSVQSLFPMITMGDDFTVLVETSSADTYIYASVVANDTNQMHYIQPVFSAPADQQAGNP
ncbi:MAG TPA: hypothetical protein VLC46_23415 [Thermoanaerobaculia bacterium]|jgi:hypothetical protein|nr:hypothetical protein [Thermoanaerobaculia bacterium]